VIKIYPERQKKAEKKNRNDPCKRGLITAMLAMASYTIFQSNPHLYLSKPIPAWHGFS
jgi:hypothetical protein